MGYEALAEVLISRLLAKTNVEEFVVYEYETLERNNRMYHGCRSADFMEAEDNKLVSVERLFQSYKGDYPLDMDLETCYGKIQAKPFSVDFDEQQDACESLFGSYISVL